MSYDFAQYVFKWLLFEHLVLKYIWGNQLRIEKGLKHKQQSDFLAIAHPTAASPLTQIEAQRDKVHACILLQTKEKLPRGEPGTKN